MDLHARQHPGGDAGTQRGRQRHPALPATVTDENGATDTQTVTITITGTDDAPDITSTTGAAVEGAVTETGLAADDTTASTGPASATGTLTATDVDTGETATLAWSISGPTTYGTMAINSATGEWTYTLDNTLAATQGLNEGDSDTQLYTATVTDENGATDTQTVTITITGTDDAPESPRPPAPRLKAQSPRPAGGRRHHSCRPDRPARPAR